VWLGAHVSIAKGFANAVKMTIKMKGNTFQFFVRNPRGGKARALEAADLLEAHALMREHHFGAVVAHAPYVYNLASTKEQIRRFTVHALKEDLQRLKLMGVPYLVVHVGTHGGQGEEQGLSLVVEGLKEVLVEIPAQTQILLEGMAGAGTELGYSFEQLAEILRRCDDHPGLGFCLDSSHLTGAGYDLAALAAVKQKIKQLLDWSRVKVWHLNDSRFPLGSRKDRHAKLGEGFLGLETIRKIVCDRELERLLFLLETPNDEAGYAAEIALVKELRKQAKML